MGLATPGWRLREAARCIDGGGIVAYPTEAVYGLGCDPYNAAAAVRLLELKQRPIDQGLILIGARKRHIAPFVASLGKSMRARIDKTWPGPYTWLLPAAPDTPYWIRGDHQTVAVRITAHPIAAALCDAVGGALVSTSANRHGRAPARSALQARLQFGGHIDCIVCGAVGPQRRPTEIRDATSGRIVRPA